MRRQKHQEDKVVKQLLRYLFKNKLLFILFLILAPITAVLEIGLAYAMGLAVNYATSGRLDEFWICLLYTSDAADD